MGDSELRNLLMDFVTREEKRGCTGSYTESVLKALRSWFVHNQRDPSKLKVKIRGARDTPLLVEERIPTKEKLRRILLSGDVQARVAIALMSNAGLRIETMGTYLGNDCLRIKDFPELKIACYLFFIQTFYCF
jgi:hypothetical protein